MVDANSFNLQPTFPIANVIDAAQKKAVYDQQFRDQQNALLLQGIQNIGTAANSIAQKRIQVAQALAASKMFMNTPEGQQILGTNNVASANGQPITQNQTAQGTDENGNILPTPQSNQSQVTPRDIATSMLGESPSNMLTQLFERQKQRQQLGIEQQKQALAERIEPQKLAAETQLNQLLGGIKQQEANTGSARAQTEDVNGLLQRRAELTKSLPKGWFDSIGNDQADAAKQQIVDIDSQLKAKGYKGSASNSSLTNGQFTTPNGTTYAVQG